MSTPGLVAADELLAPGERLVAYMPAAVHRNLIGDELALASFRAMQRTQLEEFLAEHPPVELALGFELELRWHLFSPAYLELLRRRRYTFDMGETWPSWCDAVTVAVARRRYAAAPMTAALRSSSSSPA